MSTEVLRCKHRRTTIRTTQVTFANSACGRLAEGYKAEVNLYLRSG